MVCWVSMIVLCAAVLRVAENLPLEGDVAVPDAPSSETQSFSAEEKELGDALSRDKRTIGFLRQVFPGLSQIVDRKIQMITRLVFRLIGRLVLRGGAGGGGGGTEGSNGDSGRKISITLPTYPPSEDDEDEDEDGDSTTTESDSTTTTTEASDADAENSVAESRVSEVKVRVAREAEKPEENEDQAPAATGDNDSGNGLESNEETADNEGEGSEDSPRNKRLLNFGGGGGGAGGGSGNFLFDIIRLVAGSGTTQEKDEADNAPLEEGAIGADAGVTGKDDGYSAGVPGPLTRLFVIANRGISNLLQDLILRLAQTSERIVNFKARLITSII